MRYVVVCYVTDSVNTNQFNSVCCYEFATEKAAEAFVTRSVEKNQRDYRDWLVFNQATDALENAIYVSREVTNLRIRYDVRILRDEDQCLNKRYEIMELR